MEKRDPPISQNFDLKAKERYKEKIKLIENVDSYTLHKAWSLI